MRLSVCTSHTAELLKRTKQTRNTGVGSDLALCFWSQVCEDFDVIEFNRMCWTLCYKKNTHTQRLIISDSDAFKVWCIFNFLSEDKYPLVIIIDEVRKSLIGLCLDKWLKEGKETREMRKRDNNLKGNIKCGSIFVRMTNIDKFGD